MKCISLPGINKVWYISHDLLPYDVVYRSIAGIPITFDDDPTPINLCGLASCEVQKSFDNNSYMEKTTLIFRSLDDIPVSIWRPWFLKRIEERLINRFSDKDNERKFES